jgi:hypothetical protein
VVRPAAPLPCPECEGLQTRTLVVAPDPEPPRGDPTVLRVRLCLDCGTLLASNEQLAPLDEVRKRLTALLAERTADRRAVADRHNASRRAVRKALARAPVSA